MFKNQTDCSLQTTNLRKLYKLACQRTVWRAGQVASACCQRQAEEVPSIEGAAKAARREASDHIRNETRTERRGMKRMGVPEEMQANQCAQTNAA